MTIRGASLLSRAAAFLSVLFVLSACGGGGGGGGFIDGSPGTGGGETTVPIQLALVDDQGNVTSTVTTSATLVVRILENGQNSVEGVVVTVQTDLGEIVPPSGTALTDADGIATFSILAGDVRGAGNITASATLEEGDVSASLAFQVGDTGLQLGRFDESGNFIANQIEIQPPGVLSQGGNAELTVVILDANGNRVTTVEDVSFVSGCITGGQATINPVNPVSSVNAESSTLYSVTGCAGIDEVRASIAGSNALAVGTLEIAEAETTALEFVSAEPTLIVLNGTGGENREETANVVFRVVDTTGTPLPGVNVDLTLSTFVGGLSLDKTSALTNGDGTVNATVIAGDVATTVRVIATVNVDGEEIVTLSDLLTVTTGLPDADSISISLEKAVEGRGLTTDGVEVSVTVRMADKFNNPVVDGTAAVFTTEYGSVESTCFTTDGGCSVLWRSQDPRFPLLTGTEFIRTILDSDYDCPSHTGTSGPCPDDLGFTRGGRSTITVHAIGEESFIDQNGNGIMDEAERDLFANLPEVFFDQNTDGVWTPGLSSCAASPMGSRQCIAGQEEEFVDFNSDDVFNRNDSPALYNGLLCPPEGDGIWCTRSLLQVSDDIELTLSHPDFYIIVAENGSPRDTVVDAGTDLIEFDTGYTIYVSDLYNNPPEIGSTITVTIEGDCDLLTDGSFTIGNRFEPGAWQVPLVVREPVSPGSPPEQGLIRITIEPVGNDSVTNLYSCEEVTPPPAPTM